MSASKFRMKYCKDLIEHMATGCSYVTFSARIGVTLKRMRSWEKSIPEWAEAKELGEVTCMYTWEQIIIGQARGDIKGLPATTIFALKNYFPEKFKENTALQGNGNTIVVFDSGVPIANDVKPVVEVEYSEKPQNAVTCQVKQELPEFLVDSDIISDEDKKMAQNLNNQDPCQIGNDSINEDDI